MSEKEKVLDIHDREEVMDAFGEDITIMRTGTSNKGSQFSDGDHHLSPINKDLPIDAGTGERIMHIAIGQGQRTYENPLQMAIALSHFEEWCKSSGWTPTYASIAYFLSISKGTLVKYTNDKTEYICYSILDTLSQQYIYSTSNKERLTLYIKRNSIVEESNISSTDTEERNIENHGNKSNSKSKEYKAVSVQDKLDSGEYQIVTSTTTFADTLEPINNWMEMINEEQAIHAKNPAWQIFKSLNRHGRTTQYTNKQEIAVSATNPIDELDDSAILKLVESRPDDESGIT